MTQEGSSTRHRDFAGALKHAALAALVAFGLFSLLVGIRTDTGPGGALELSERFETLAVLVAAAFAGVFLREILFSGGFVRAASVPESVRRSRWPCTKRGCMVRDQNLQNSQHHRKPA